MMSPWEFGPVLNKLGATLSLLLAACATPSAEFELHSGRVTGAGAMHFVELQSFDPLVYETGTRIQVRTSTAVMGPQSNGAGSAPPHRCPSGDTVALPAAGLVSAVARDAVASICASFERAKNRMWLAPSTSWNIRLTFLPNNRRGAARRFSPETRQARGLFFMVSPEKFQTPAERARLGGFLVHEAFHIDLAAQGLGRRAARYADLPTTGRVFEETAGYLITYCDTILAGHAVLASEQPNGIIDMAVPGEPRRRIEAPFSDAEISGVLGWLDREDRQEVPALALYLGFQRTVFLEVSGGEARIEPETPAADRLLDICDAAASDIGSIRSQLVEMASDGIDTQGLSVAIN